MYQTASKYSSQSSCLIFFYELCFDKAVSVTIKFVTKLKYHVLKICFIRQNKLKINDRSVFCLLYLVIRVFCARFVVANVSLIHFTPRLDQHCHSPLPLLTWSVTFFTPTFWRRDVLKRRRFGADKFWH